MPAAFGELSRTVIFSHALSAVQAAQAGLILNENPHKSTESLIS